jgi:hypothetical protein
MRAYSPLSEVRSASGVLIDTNLLLLWAVFEIAPSKVETSQRTRAYTFNEARVLGHLIASAKQWVTTPHILTECSNLLLRQLKGADYQLACTWLEWYFNRADERWRAASTATCWSSTLLRRLGLTDATLAFVASEGLVVLTDDARLCAALSEKDIAFVNFHQIRDDLMNDM